MLLRPDTYVGSCDPVTKEMWVWDAPNERMVSKTVTYVPGLFKIFGKQVLLLLISPNRFYYLCYR